jgi:hypothetical protein
MFDHVGLNVRDYVASRSFYEQALAPLGYSAVQAPSPACASSTTRPTTALSCSTRTENNIEVCHRPE